MSIWSVSSTLLRMLLVEIILVATLAIPSAREFQVEKMVIRLSLSSEQAILSDQIIPLRFTVITEGLKESMSFMFRYKGDVWSATSTRLAERSGIIGHVHSHVKYDISD